MSRRSLSHLSDPALRVALKESVAGERTSTADLVAHIAEYDARKLYVPDGFPSMLAYAVAELQLSEDAAGRRITAARVVRRFPVVLDAMDDGRLNTRWRVLVIERPRVGTGHTRSRTSHR